MKKIKVEREKECMQQVRIFDINTLQIEWRRVLPCLKPDENIWLLDTGAVKEVTNINITLCKFREFEDF